MPAALAALTFDFWDTLVHDDSDEAVRAARGLPTKAQARRQSFVDEILAHHPDLGAPAVQSALTRANAWAQQRWDDDRVTPTVAERLDHGLAALGLARTAGFDALVATWEGMEVEIPPRLADHVPEALAALAGRYRLGIVSDTIVTPGRGLKQVLASYGVLQHFEVFVFSDEAGASKPARRVFTLAEQGFGLGPDVLAHVGDREGKDVDGALDAGWRAVLYTGVKDRRPGQPTRAQVVCTDHAALFDQLAALS